MRELKQVREKILNRLPLAFLALVPLFWLGGFLLGGLQKYSVSNIQAIALYPTYATLVSVMLAGLYGLYRRDGSGTASILYVLFFYEMAFFSVTLWGVSAIVLIQALIPPLGELEIITQFARAFVSSGMGGTFVAVLAFYGAVRSGNLAKRIPLFPWSRGSRGKRTPK